MKIVAVFFLLFLFIMGLNLGMDLLLGQPFRRAVSNLFNPFWVTSGPEMVLGLIVMSVWMVNSIVTSLRQKKKG